MPDDITPATAVIEQPTASAGTQETSTETAKTFTQADVDRMISERLNRQAGQHQKTLEQTRLEAREAALKEAQMTEAEKSKAEAEKYRVELEEERSARINAERRASLVGKVADAGAALKLLDTKHVNDDQTINVDKLLEDYPFLKPATTTPSVEATTGGGGKATTSLEQEANAAYARGDMVTYIALTNKIQKG